MCDIVDKLRQQAHILNANTGGGEYLDEAADRIEELEKLVRAVSCGDISGLSLHDVDGKNWFDLRRDTLT